MPRPPPPIARRTATWAFSTLTPCTLYFTALGYVTQSIALTVSLVAWEHERKRLENQSSRLERKKHQDLHQRKRVHAHFDETIEEAFRERRRRKRQMSLVTLDVSRENDEEIQEEIRSIVPRIVEEDKRRKNVEEKRKKKRKGERRSREAKESFCSLLLFWSGLFFF